MRSQRVTDCATSVSETPDLKSFEAESTEADEDKVERGTSGILADHCPKHI